MIPQPVSLRSVLAAALISGAVILAWGCSGSGGGADGGEADARGIAPDRSRFARFGAETIYQRDESIEHPVVVVFGILGSSDVPGVLAEEVRCRRNADAVISFPISADGQYRDPNIASTDLALLLQELRASGTDRITVFGHHLGGLVARSALTQIDPASGSQPIDLITVFTPFAGVPPNEMRAIYPASLGSSSPFIQQQSALPPFVAHQKYEVAETGPVKAISDLGEDRLLFDSQSFTAVDSDRSMTLRERRELLPWPLSITTLLETILQRSGFGPNTCRPAQLAEPQSPGSALAALGRVDLKDDSDEASVPFDEEELARSGIQAPALDGAFDPSKPTLVLTHGVGASPNDLDNLEAALAVDYNVFRFIYDESANTNPDFADIADDFSDETDDLVTISERQGAAIKKVQALTDQTVIYQVAYSLGGVISRHPITDTGAGSLADESFASALVTVAAPFGGTFAGNFNPIFWLSAVTPLPGAFFGSFASASDYIANPGQVAPQNLHFSIKSIEAGRTFNGEDDEQISLEDQANDVVDTDPNNVATTFPAGSFQLVGGHLEIINDPNSIVVIKAAVDFLRRKKEGVSVPEIQPTPTPGATDGGSGQGTDGTTGSEGSGSGDGSDEGGSDTGPRFGCRSGRYTPFGNSSCGLTQFDLGVGNGFVRLSPFGTNGSVTFDIQKNNIADQDGLDILGGDQHTCTLLCTDPKQLLLAVRCTNPRGGRCAQGYSGVSRD